MIAAFRVDASNVIGIGHVIRCLVLAEALNRRGVRCVFLCREHRGNLVELIAGCGFSVERLDGVEVDSFADAGAADYAGWLGASWRSDARQTGEALDRTGSVDWLVADHYGVDARWEDKVRPRVRRLAVIDDLANRPHSCDLLLDQNFFGSAATDRYRGLVPKESKQLLGPRHALLRPEYALLKRWRPRHDGMVRRVLMFFGGSDPDNVTGKALAALSETAFSNLIVDVVLGPNHPCPEAIDQQASRLNSTFVHRHLSSLAGLMFRSDLMLGAGGATNWERMCLGVPAIVISIADNQTPINRALHEHGYIEFLGRHQDVTLELITQSMTCALTDGRRLSRQSRAGMELVPGDGADAMADLMLKSC